MILKTLRLEYLFSVLTSVLLAIYINNLEIINYIKFIGGWIFFGICGNLLNDIKDQDRSLEFSKNQLIAFFLISFLFGFLLMIESFIYNILNLIFFFTSAILVVLYCFKIKKYAIINKFVLVSSHIVFPYLMVKIPNISEPTIFGQINIILGVFMFSIAGQIIHEISDQEAFRKYQIKLSRFVILIFSFISIIFCLVGTFLLFDLYLLPLITIPIGILFLFRKQITPKNVHKRAGILVGNLLMIYFLFLLI